MSKKMLLAQAFYYLTIPMAILIFGGTIILYLLDVLAKDGFLTLVLQVTPGFLVVVFLRYAVNEWRRGIEKEAMDDCARCVNMALVRYFYEHPEHSADKTISSVARRHHPWASKHIARI